MNFGKKFVIINADCRSISSTPGYPVAVYPHISIYQGVIKMAEQKKQEPTNGEFKTAPLGFDKNEVMAYIVQINKGKKALQEEVDELKRALEAKEAEVPDTSALEEIEKKKAELDAQILDSRKQVLDERRKLAQTEKELHVLQDQYKALAEEYTEFKQKAKKKLEKAKKSGGGTINEAQLEEISAKANADANEVIADANKKAQEIIDAAKAYYEDTVKKAQEYKQTVLTKGGEYSGSVTNGSGAISATVNVFELLSAVAQEINDAVNSAIDSASEKAKAETENTSAADEKKLSEDEAVVAARTALEASEEATLGEYAPMAVAPYDFKLTIDMPEGTEVADDDDDDDDDEDFITPDENGLLSSFAVISSADTSDDDMSAGTDNSFGEEDVVITTPSAIGFDDISDLMMDAAPAKAEAPTPAPAVKTDDDISDLFTSAPAPVPAPVKKEAPAPAPEVKADDDISDLFTSAPAPAPAPAKKEAPAPAPEVKADDDISDLFTSTPAPAPAKKTEPAPAPEVKADDDISDLFTSAPAEEAPKYKRAHSREGYGSNGEKLNESGAMGVAGKEAKPNDPWKDLEAQMNGMTFTTPSAPAGDLDDGMTSSYDDAPVEQETKADDKIDMSDYSSMLGGVNDNMNSSAAQFDPNWEFQMMEGSGDDEDDEMSSDNVGFFDL